MSAVAVLRRVAVVVGLLGVASAVVRQPETPRLTIYAEFNRAGLNIRAGDEVRVRGVPVGRIAAITVDRSDFSARYELSLAPGTRVARDSSAQVVPKTVFGDKYVALDPAPSYADAMAPNTVIGQDRTTEVAELEGVIDDATRLLEAANPAALGSTMAAMAQGLGNGDELLRASNGFSTGLSLVGTSEDDLRRLLAATPTLAAALAAHAGDIAGAAHTLGQVVAVLAEEEPALAQALRDDGELLRRATNLMADPRVDRFVSGGLKVLRIVAGHPGAVEAFLKAVPAYVYGLANAVHGDTLYAVIPHLFIGLPWVDAGPPNGDADGGTGIGPDVVVSTPPYTDPYVPLGEEPSPR